MSWMDRMNDPKMVAALEEARAILDRSIYIFCPWGNCEMDVDPVTNRIGGGVGSVGCLCEYLPGGDSVRPEGRPMPAVPAKVAGRHGSRVQRSQHRHRIPEWIRELHGL